jgi:drug/metabolite transporter (DMT)-like permease
VFQSAAFPARPRLAGFTGVDAWLLLLVVIWGSNFSVVKATLEEIPPFGFNALRLIVASAVLVPPVLLAGFRPPAPRDWPRLIALGLFGHCLYQLFFVRGLSMTSSVNSALILGCVPVAVLLLNVMSARREPVGWAVWTGVGLSFVGVYLVVASGSGLDGAGLWGDLATMVAVWCWAWYTIGARSLLLRYSPLQVTTYSMMVGTVFFLPFGVPDLLRLDWAAVSPWAWVALVASGVLALSVSYLIWYTAVQRMGSARTSIYSNLVPVMAMVVAATWLNEPIGWAKLAGAALILAGLALTRIE